MDYRSAEVMSLFDKPLDDITTSIDNVLRRSGGFEVSS